MNSKIESSTNSLRTNSGGGGGGPPPGPQARRGGGVGGGGGGGGGTALERKLAWERPTVRIMNVERTESGISDTYWGFESQLGAYGPITS